MLHDKIWCVYTIPGPPKAKQRVRVTKRGAYDAQYQEKSIDHMRFNYQRCGDDLWRVPITVHFTFVMQIPSSFSKKRRRELRGAPVVKRPDLSNMIKYIEDVGNQSIWYDDTLIVHVSGEKVYGDVPHTLIYVRAYDGESMIV